MREGRAALVLAEAYGCRVVGVERLPEFADEARRRIAERGLDDLIEVRTGDARELPLEPETWDAALCLGASFVWGTLAETAAVLAPAVRPGGFVAVGEPYWRAMAAAGGRRRPGLRAARRDRPRASNGRALRSPG